MQEHTFFTALAQMSAPAPTASGAAPVAPATGAAVPATVGVSSAPATGRAATGMSPEVNANLPAAPTDFQQNPVSTSELTIAWKDAATNETGYHIARSTDGTTFTALPDLPKDSTSFKDTGLSTGTTYIYKVSAYNASGDSAPLIGKAATSPGFFGQFGTIIMMVVMFGALYLFLFRGQRKEAKKKKEMMSELKKGDKVMTIGGMVARVVSIDGEEVVLKIDESANVKATYRKSAIQEVLDRDEKK